MSSTSSPSPSAAETSQFGWTGNAPAGGVSSSLYLFTFLITILVLALISGGLLLRAYYVRRQFRQRVEEAIRAGRPLPEDAAVALGLRSANANNRKKEKKHGPMPGIWEAEMDRDGEKWEVGRDEKADWEGIVPLSVTHEAPPPPPPAPIDPSAFIPQPRGPRILRPFRTPQMPDLSAYIAQHPRPGLARTLTGISLPPIEPMWTIPDDGEEVTIGVLIAMPVEGREAEKWELDDTGEDRDLPEVCLGVMGCAARA